VSAKPLLITPTDVETLHASGTVRMIDYVDAVERAFRGQGERALEILPRQVLWRDAKDAGVRSPALKMSASVLRSASVMGASVYSAHFRPGDLNMWIMLFSAENGELQAILHGREMSLWKTGATAAAAARHMARPDARSAAIIGTGYFARTQVLGLAAVRPLERLRCYSRDPARRAAFAAWAREQLPGVDAAPAASAGEALRGADIVVTVTTSPKPVLEGAWLEPGMHCNVMGQHDPRAREVDSEAVATSRVVVDSLAQAWNEKGELLIPLAEGRIAKDHVLGELGDVIVGRVAARRNAGDRTMFCSGGTALEYMGTCAMLLDKARAAGVGQELRI
jgi:ornithine cyclodeaminase/alanine dehydrogenase-like protein (mu-crystallin family)